MRTPLVRLRDGGNESVRHIHVYARASPFATEMSYLRLGASPFVLAFFQGPVGTGAFP